MTKQNSLGVKKDSGIRILLKKVLNYIVIKLKNFFIK